MNRLAISGPNEDFDVIIHVKCGPRFGGAPAAMETLTAVGWVG